MDIHNVVHVATKHAGDADNAATHASADQSIATSAPAPLQGFWQWSILLMPCLFSLFLVSQSDDDVALLFKRKHDELDRLFIETQQDRQELARRYAAVQKQLERVHVENEYTCFLTLIALMWGLGARYLMAELSRYSASDLESDQSDIELHYTPHTRRSLLPSPTTTESDAVASNKAKVKAAPVVKADGTTPTKDTTTKPKRRRASTSTAATSASSTVPKKLSPKTKKPKKATE